MSATACTCSMPGSEQWRVTHILRVPVLTGRALWQTRLLKLGTWVWRRGSRCAQQASSLCNTSRGQPVSREWSTARQTRSQCRASRSCSEQRCCWPWNHTTHSQTAVLLERECITNCRDLKLQLTTTSPPFQWPFSRWTWFRQFSLGPLPLLELEENFWEQVALRPTMRNHPLDSSFMKHCQTREGRDGHFPIIRYQFPLLQLHRTVSNKTLC